MPRKSQKSQSLPSNPHIATRLYLRRLEAQGVDTVQKLTISHWETIQRLEAGDVSPLVITRGGAR